MPQTKTLIQIPDFITVRDLAGLLGANPIDVIKKLMSNGIMANINQQIDYDTASIVAGELGFETAPIVGEEEAETETAVEEHLAWRKILANEDKSALKPRPPVVTMLGHVDHGKTSLLDVLRRANVTAGEAGGITQHIGAYQIQHEGQTITFLDTPGHEAFTAMRARGAQATDIAILVVAADDGVMPQTREAADHARAARVAIVVAMNKIDLPSSNPNRVKQQLAEIGLVPDDWDGDTLIIPVSAKQKLGIDDLLEAILLTNEEIAPKANPKAPPTGTVLETKQERGRGPVATLLVQNGTLRSGDTLLIGPHYGRIKAMYDFRGKPLKSATPSTPVAVSGLNGLPQPGDQFRVVENEKVARKLAEEYVASRQQVATRAKVGTLDDFFSRLQQGEAKTLNLVVKADVQGSLEPLVNSLQKIGTEEVGIEILHASTGNITESDIMLASASDAIILGFNVSADGIARNAAANEQVEIKFYSVIYHLLEDVEKALKGLLEPVYQDVVIGRAEVRQTFKIKSVGMVAGCFMRTGEAKRTSSARIIRGTQLLHTGKITSLKHLQESVREVKAGFEFGVSVDNWDKFLPGDILEFFVSQKVEN